MTKLELHKERRLRFAVWVIALFCAFYLLVFYVNVDVLAIMLLVAIHLVCAPWVFGTGHSPGLLVGSAPLYAYAFSALATNLIFYNPESIAVAYNQGIAYIVFFAISIAVLGLLLKYMDLTVNFKTAQKILHVLMCCASSFGAYALVKMGDTYFYPYERYGVYITLSIIMIFFTGYALYLFSVIGHYAKQRLDEKIKAQTEHYELNYVHTVERAMKTSMQQRHDFVKHIQVMLMMYNNQKHEELTEYFQELTGEYRTGEIVVFTDSTSLNALLTVKNNEARDMGFDINIHVTLTQKIPLSNTGLTTLFANLLDNALEACKKIEVQDRYVTVRISQASDLDMIKIVIGNSFNGDTSIKNGEYISTKREHGHGIGLERVREIAEEAGGFIEVHAVEKEFSVMVFLPTEHQERDYD